MKVEAVVFDLDGTLLSTEHKISDYTKSVIEKVKQKGIPVFIATGRLYTSLNKYREEIDVQNPVVCYNGAMVVDPKTQEVLLEEPLPKETAAAMIEIARNHKTHLNIFEGDKWYVECFGDEAQVYMKTSGLSHYLIDFDHLDRYVSHVHKVMFVGENEKLLEIEKELEEKFGKNIYKAFSKPHFLEVLSSKISKGSSLIKILNEIGINPENVIAFGDAYNDVEMISGVGHGVAMGNAPDDVKAVAKYVCGTNNEDGAAKFLVETLNLSN